MDPWTIWSGMWIKIFKIFFPAVIFFIAGLAYIYVDERKVR